MIDFNLIKGVILKQKIKIKISIYKLTAAIISIASQTENLKSKSLTEQIHLKTVQKIKMKIIWR